MIKNDFPSKWTQFINQIHTCLSTNSIDVWESALLVFYTLIQHYEYELNLTNLDSKLTFKV